MAWPAGRRTKHVTVYLSAAELALWEAIRSAEVFPPSRADMIWNGSSPWLRNSPLRTVAKTCAGVSPRHLTRSNPTSRWLTVSITAASTACLASRFHLARSRVEGNT